MSSDIPITWNRQYLIEITGDQQANIVSAQRSYRSTGRLTYLAVQSPWPEQGRVEGVWPVGSHDHLHLTERVKAVHLIQQLQTQTHRTDDKIRRVIITK